MRHLKRLAVVMLVMAMILSTAGIAGAYPDTAGRTCAEAVAYLRDLGVVAGFPDGTYKPDATLTRAQAAKIVVISKYGSDSLANLLKGAVAFTDVPGTHWASGFIALAKNAGIIIGYPDGTFQPEGLVTYAELAKMLVEAAGLSPIAGLGWPANYVGAAQAAGMLAGVPLFAANSPATRGDCAIMAAYTVQEVKNPATGKTLAQSAFGKSIVASVTVTPTAISLGAGKTTTLTAVAKDAAGNVVDVPFTWTSSNTVVATVVGGFVGAVAPGTATITVAAEGKQATVGITVFGAASAVVFDTPASLVANDKSETPLVAKVVDVGGRVVLDYAGTITFASSVPTYASVKTASVAAVNGVATTALKAGTAVGTTVLTASATGLSGATMYYTTVAQVLTSVEAKVDPTAVAAAPGSAAKITLRQLDQTGNPMLTGKEITAKLTSAAPSLFSFHSTNEQAEATVDFTGGVVTGELLVYARASVGAATVTGAVTTSGYTAVTVNPVTINSRVVGAPYRLSVDPITAKKSGTAHAVTVRVLDFNGNQVTIPGWATDIKLYYGSAEVGTGNAYAAVPYGQVTITLSSIPGAMLKVGTYTLTAKSGNLVEATGAASVIVGDAAQLKLTASPTTIRADGVATSTLTVNVTDANDNPVTTGSYEVTISKTTDQGATKAFTATKVTTVDGQASVVVTAQTLHDKMDTFTASHTTLGTTTATVTSRVMGTATALKVESVSPANTAAAGATITVKVGVYDSLNGLLGYDNGRPVTLEVREKGETGTLVQTLTAETVNGIATFTTSITKILNGYTFKATSAGLTKAVEHGAAYYVITHATGVGIKATATLTTLAADAGSSETTVTATIVDAYGNTVDTGIVKFGATAPTFALSTGTYLGAVGGPVQASDYKYTQLYKSTAAAGATTVSVSFTGLTAGTADIVTQVVGAAHSYKLEVTGPTTVSTGATKQTLTVTLVDANGNRLTADTAKIQLTFSGSANPAKVRLYKSDGTTVYTPGDDVVFVAGQYKFYIANETAETITYKVVKGTGDTRVLADKTIAGAFIPAAASGVQVFAATPFVIKGDGSSVTVLQAKVVDSGGNTVTTATGTMKFSIVTGSDFATLLQTSAPVTAGVATVTLQSKAVSGAGSYIKVKAAMDVTGDGVDETHELAQTAFVYGQNTVVIRSITLQNKAGGTAGTLEIGDKIVIEFAHAVKPSTINAGLTAGGTVADVAHTATGGVVLATGAKTITVTKIVTITATDVSADSNATVDLTLSSDAKTLTITIKTVSAASTVTTPFTAAVVDVTTPVTDGVLNLLVGPVPLLPTGNF